MEEKPLNSFSGKTAKTVVIHTAQGFIEAEIVQTCLRAHGIESATQGLAAQSVHPFTVDGMGKIKILVMENDEEAAREIIESFLKDDLGEIKDPNP
jgi:predicted dinucleotide-binding enzyme